MADEVAIEFLHMEMVNYVEKELPDDKKVNVQFVHTLQYNLHVTYPTYPRCPFRHCTVHQFFFDFYAETKPSIMNLMRHKLSN